MTRSIQRFILALLVISSLVACGEANTTAPAPTTASGATSAPATTPEAQATQPAAATEPAATEPAGTTPSGEPILIGVAVAQTSNVSLFGQEQVIGAKIAEKYYNDKGGINGRPVKIVFQDTAGDENGAINAFQTLINQDNVVAIVGPTLSQQALAADPIAEQAKVPVIGPSNTAKGIPQLGEYISRVSAPVTAVAPNAIQYAMELNPNIKKVAVLFAQNDAFSKSETVVFQMAVTDTFKLDLAPVQTFQTTDTDFTTQATAVLNEKPDLVIISGLAADGGNLVKQLRELGYEGLIVGGNGFNTPNIFPVCQSLCEGIIVAQAYNYQEESDVNKAFREAYKAEQGKEPPQFSAQAFSGVQVIIESLIALDNKTKLDTLALPDLRTQLNQEILAGTYTSPLGEISFTPEGEINQKTFYVARVKMNDSGTDGVFEFAK